MIFFNNRNIRKIYELIFTRINYTIKSFFSYRVRLLFYFNIYPIIDVLVPTLLN